MFQIEDMNCKIICQRILGDQYFEWIDFNHYYRVMMSEHYEQVKYYYDNYTKGVAPSWDLARVRKAVAKGWITEKEFKKITGKDY